MIKHSESLKRKIEVYLKHLTKPQIAWGGHAICPGLEPFRHQVHIQMARADIEDQINHTCWMLYPLDIPAVVIATALPPKNLYEITDAALVLHPDIEIFVNDPTAKGLHRGIYTGFEHAWLIIIQKRSLLREYQEIAKNAGYYNQKNADE